MSDVRFRRADDTPDGQRALPVVAAVRGPGAHKETMPTIQTEAQRRRCRTEGAAGPVRVTTQESGWPLAQFETGEGVAVGRNTTRRLAPCPPAGRCGKRPVVTNLECGLATIDATLRPGEDIRIDNGCTIH